MGRIKYDFRKRKKSFSDRIWDKLPGFGTWVKIFIVAFIILSVFFYIDNKTLAVTNYPEPTNYFFVEDYSGVLNEYTEKYIYNEAAALYHKTKAQIVVVTVPNTQADDLETYSNKLANKWGIGDEELDNGVLFLIETHETYPHVRLEIGRGLEGTIPDGLAGRILDDYAVDAKENGRWNECAGNTFTAILKKVYAEYDLSIPDTVDFGSDWHDGKDDITQGTFADAAFPDKNFIKNEKPVAEQIYDACATAFGTILVLIGFVLMFIFIVAFLPDGSGRGGSSSGGFGGFDSGSSGSSGGGYSGGGGSFGGGGASR